MGCATIEIQPDVKQEDVYEWLPCAVGEAVEAERDTYFKATADEDCDGTHTTHLRGRQLKGGSDSSRPCTYIM